MTAFWIVCVWVGTWMIFATVCGTRGSLRLLFLGMALGLTGLSGLLLEMFTSISARM